MTSIEINRVKRVLQKGRKQKIRKNRTDSVWDRQKDLFEFGMNDLLSTLVATLKESLEIDTK